MRLLPRTLFWRAFAAQMVLMSMSFALVIAFISRDQARTTADNIVAVWAPALREALGEDDLSVQPLDIRVVQDVTLMRGDPPPDAYEPWASPRFFALRRALQRDGVDARRVVVSGVTDDSVIWLQVRQGSATRWIGVASNLEGEDFPRRVLILSLVGLALAGAVAAALSRMVARPTRQLARAVQAFGHGQPLPSPPVNAPTEIDVLARTVAQTFEQRRELDAQRDLMLAGLSHDVRSPLARIRLAAELLPDGDAETRDLKQRIGHNVAVLDRLIGSFADYVRAEQGPLDRQVDVGAVAREAAASFGLDPRTVSVNGQPFVLSHGDLLRRALDNLIDNALRYGRAPILLSVSAQGDQVQVAVSNAGQPIDAAELTRLLRPFERGERHRATPGSGLGLAIVERIARRHGGRFELQPTHQPAGTRALLVLGVSAQPQNTDTDFVTR